MLQVVLTGGPSSGKTSVINRVVEQFKELRLKRNQEGSRSATFWYDKKRKIREISNGKKNM